MSGHRFSSEPQSQETPAADRSLEMSEPNAEYADVAEMCRALRMLDEGTVAYRRQRDDIVKQPPPLAERIARRFRGGGDPHEDLYQAACVGLVQAVNRFDPDNGADFLAFAVPTIMGEVRRYFRDFGWAVKVPRRLKELQPQLVKAHEELVSQIDRAPTASEIANQFGIDRESVVEAMLAGSSYSTISTDVQAGSDDQRWAGGNPLGGGDPGFQKVIDVETVRPLIAALPERERTAITLRFFGEMTQTQIAERMGYSQMHVSRLLARGLNRLRSQTREPDLRATATERSKVSSAQPRKRREHAVPAARGEYGKPAR